MKSILSLFLFFGLSSIGFAQNFNGGFPFDLPVHDGTLAPFIGDYTSQALQASDKVTAIGPHFKNENGEIIRFWGVNIVAAAAFPDTSLSKGIAQRLRKMGVNLVRFHHLENNWSGPLGGLFDYNNGSRTMNPVALDRLDYLIYCLAQEGIYTNMNLNVSRVFQAQDGVVDANELVDFAKGVTLYDPRLQFLQKEYAQQLLGHVNPYLGQALSSHPCLAMVEMNNENSLYGYWKSDALTPQSQGGNLTPYYNNQLDQIWLAWLQDRYASNADLAQAWNVGLVPAGLGQVVQNPSFENATTPINWTLELHSTAQATFTTTTLAPQNGTRAAQLQVDNHTGTDWHIQCKQGGLALEANKLYEVTFWVRSSNNAPMNLSIMQDGAPYNWFNGFSFPTTGTWREVRLNVQIPVDEPNARFTISPTAAGTYWIDQVFIGQPSVSGVLNGEDLNGTVSRIPYTQVGNYSVQRVADMSNFYIEVQRRHFNDLKAYLNDSLSVTAPITGTNALTGPADVAYSEALDFIDDHSYWDHPQFPNNAWDPSDWLINNASLLKTDNLEAITNIMGGLQLADKPYTISEYNHGAPNRYRTEMVPAMASYGSFHGMDGIMFFDYNGGRWTNNPLDNFFSLYKDHSIMALFPSCARAFRKGWIQEDPSPLKVAYSKEMVYQMPFDDNQGRWSKYHPYDTKLSLTNSIRTQTYKANTASGFDQLPTVSTSPYVTTTNEVTWDQPAGVLMTQSPYFVSMAGALDAVSDKDLNAEVRWLSGNDFGVSTWVSMTDAPLRKSARTLFSLTSVQQNTNMQWNGNQTINDNWGTIPTVQKPIQANWSLTIDADSVRVYPLNETGQTTASSWVIYPINGKFDISINQETHPSLWFGMEAFGGSIVSTQTVELPLKWQVFPNPSVLGTSTQVSWSEPIEGWLELYDLQGKQVWRKPVSSDLRQMQISTTNLASGTYIVQFLDIQGAVMGAKKLILR